MIIYRELGATIVPFEPLAVSRMLEGCTVYKDIATGEETVALVMGEIHKTGDPSEICAVFESHSQGYRLAARGLSFFGERPDFFLVPARDRRSEEIGVFLVTHDTPGIVVGDSSRSQPNSKLDALNWKTAKSPIFSSRERRRSS